VTRCTDTSDLRHFGFTTFRHWCQSLYWTFRHHRKNSETLQHSGRSVCKTQTLRYQKCLGHFALLHLPIFICLHRCMDTSNLRHFRPKILPKGTGAKLPNRHFGTTVKMSLLADTLESVPKCLGHFSTSKAQIPLGSTRLDSTHSTCRARAFWLCRASRTAQLDSLDTSSTGSTRQARLARHVELDRRYLQLSYDHRNSFV